MLRLFSRVFLLIQQWQELWRWGTNDYPQVAVGASHIQQENKPEQAGFELSATALIRGSWVIACLTIRQETLTPC